MEKILLICIAIYITGIMDAKAQAKIDTQSTGAFAGTHEMVPGHAIIINSAQAYAFPDTNIRAVLVNSDLYAMLDKTSETKGAFVACGEINNANVYAARPMFTTNYFGFTQALNEIEKWRRRVAVDAVSKQATLVGFDCKVGSAAELTKFINEHTTAIKHQEQLAKAAEAKNIRSQEERIIQDEKLTPCTADNVSSHSRLITSDGKNWCW